MEFKHSKSGLGQGILEWWNDGFEGRETIKYDLFRFYCPLFHYSNIPSFHVDGINQMLLK